MTLVEPLEATKVESLRYESSLHDDEVIEITISEKVYFDDGEQFPDIDLNEEFDDSIAEKITPMRGKLVSYQAMATKYPFNFQPRERPDVLGRRFIPCMLENEQRRDDFIELMKTSHKGHVIMEGYGIKDISGFYRRIKISDLKEDRDPQLF